jgi:hypothetical protein
MVVSDSSPIIYLAKLGRLDLLRILYKQVYISEAVQKELTVVDTSEEREAEIIAIKQAIDKGWIKVKKVKLKNKLIHSAPELSVADKETIELSRKMNAELTIIDDEAARRVARNIGIRSRGTIYVLLESYTKKKVTKAELKRMINTLVTAGFRLSPELYSQLMERLEQS